MHPRHVDELPTAGSTWVRFAGFGVATFLAGWIGRLTYDESLHLSLVWPLYGLVIVWLASGNRATWLWDVLAMSVAVAAAVLVDGGSWQQTVVATVLAAPTAALWLVVMRRLSPDEWRAGGPRHLTRQSGLMAFLIASAVTAITAAVLRSSGLGLVPAASGVEEVLLTAVRNLSWILGLGALGLLLMPLLPVARELRATMTDRRSRPGPTRVLEVLLVASATVFVATVAFAPTPTPLAFAMVLAAVWAGFRLPTVAGVALSLAMGTAAVIATLKDRGVFVVDGSDFEGAAVAQAFLITLVVSVLAISIDAEERRAATERARVAEAEAEARARLFSAVIEHLDEGVTVVNAEDDYTVRNRAARRLSGVGGFLRPASDDPGQGVMVDADGTPLAVSEMPHSRARAESRVIRESVRVRLPSGAVRHLEISSIPVPWVSDEHRALVVNTLRDITEEHEERDQLVSFAGVVAHDLKNPLTVIGGWSESIQEELDSGVPPDVPALRAMVGRVQSASAQMLAFIDDLLNMTVARDRPLEREVLDVSLLAEEVAELRRSGGAQVQIAALPGLSVLGDRFLLRQLFDNLIGNAVKYVAPDVRPQVVVEAREEGDNLEISVTDNGIGIPVEARQRVFDSFVRAHGTSYTGTGLGLAICARVVSRHGGRIWVAEHHGPGTRISFTLPRG